MSIFYRVGHKDNDQGLWYHPDGHFTGLIHKSDCKCKDLEMPFDQELVGWLSATESLEELFAWFPKEDILVLQSSDFFIHVYEALEYKYYHRFSHNVIRQDRCKLIGTLILD